MITEKQKEALINDVKDCIDIEYEWGSFDKSIDWEMVEHLFIKMTDMKIKADDIQLT